MTETLRSEREINLLFEDTRGHARSSQQIVGLLERRIECKSFLKERAV